MKKIKLFFLVLLVNTMVTQPAYSFFGTSLTTAIGKGKTSFQDYIKNNPQKVKQMKVAVSVIGSVILVMTGGAIYYLRKGHRDEIFSAAYYASKKEGLKTRAALSEQERLKLDTELITILQNKGTDNPLHLMQQGAGGANAYKVFEEVLKTRRQKQIIRNELYSAQNDLRSLFKSLPSEMIDEILTHYKPSLKNYP